MLTHTTTCLKAEARRKAKQAKWLDKWPNHCRYCKAQTDGEYPCPHCLYNLTCPRCGKAEGLHPEDATAPCTSCGWRDMLEHLDGCPPDYICVCRVAKEKRDKAELERLSYLRRKLDSEIAKLQRQRARL